MKTGTIGMDEHAIVKHRILEQYLKAWFPIVSNFGTCIYVDALAGEGQIKLKSGEVSEGSPLVVLNMLKEHVLIERIKRALLIFIELDDESVEALKNNISGVSIPDSIDIEIIHGDFHEKIKNIIDLRRKSLYFDAPMFVFIDPYGYSISMDAIQGILGGKSAEVLITFMYSYVNRAVNSGKHDEKLTMLYGGEEWKNVRDISDSEKRREYLVRLYEEKLKKSAKHVLYFEIKDKNNRTYYLLFFATNSIKGIEVMKRAMWNNSLFDADFAWSDRVGLAQTALFEKKPNFELIEKIIFDKFEGKRVKIWDIERFILLETPYLKSHYKKPLGNLEKEGLLKVVDGKRSQRYRYPDKNMIVEFITKTKI